LEKDATRWAEEDGQAFVNHMFLDIRIRYNSYGCEFRSVRHFQSEVFVLVDDDGHAFDIWEYTGDGSVAKLHNGLHLFLARDPGCPRSGRDFFTLLLAVFESGV
jgi:hypothetical protein